jgi:tripartite-type tricarboxylate transporter receptor subunit TctC
MRTGDRERISVVLENPPYSLLKTKEENMKTVLAVLLAMAGIGEYNSTAAQTYPAKSIRFVVPFSPGGGTDLQARTIGKKLHETWGHPVIVDHRPGGTGAVGSAVVLQDPADGYTILIVTSSTHAISPNLFRKPPYIPIRDFVAVAQTATAPEVLFAHPSLPVKTAKELIAFAKTRPGALNFGSAGTGSIGHMTGELFKLVTGVDIVHIPYKGSGATVVELLGGQVEMSFGAPGAMITHVRAGKLRVLGVLTAERSPLFKDIPTLAELGYPQIDASNWYGILVRTGTPQEIVNKLNREVNRIVLLPETKKLLYRQGYTVRTGTPAQFAELMRKDSDKWAKVVKDSGMRLK